MPAPPASPFRLFLLRHAQAGWAAPGQKDFDRALDDTGYGQAELVADRAADRGLKPQRIISSTAVRCRQTTEAFRRALGEDTDIRYSDDLYTGGPETYRSLATAQDDVTSLMLVGHNPMIEEFLRTLVGEEAATLRIPLGYPPAGLALVEFDTQRTLTAPGTATLAAWLSPNDHG
ncbi:phosphohistidine phosphatase [Rhizobium sp. RU20A]|uniref:SixA phosphatase family protein n=1 Tax=Rhizobium sp. RU20A TaxID=1907412 RepID=UPI0009557019|nr:histidine phosphatase family protein [Rhizobium sp. RU20A]SIQ13268.1 phosphohistidine phosphatase [Rhizobium sp. RU20A]